VPPFVVTLNTMKSENDIAVSVRDLVKVFGPATRTPIRALDGLSLEVKRGEILGLLGRNGAGKTTLLRILTTLIQPTSGFAEVWGHDVGSDPYGVRQSICAVLQENAVEIYLSVLDNLRTFARFHSIPKWDVLKRADHVMGLFGLDEYRHQRVIDLSGGLRRRVQVAKVFMVDKPVVFLDEATTGMDPIFRRATLEAIRGQAEQGRTMLLTTHMLQEAEELCDRIAIVEHGRCIATGDLPTIKAMAMQAYDVTVTFSTMRPGIIDAAKRFPLLKMNIMHTTLEFSLKASDVSTLVVLDALAKVEPIVHFEVTSASLEDVFLELLDHRGNGGGGEVAR
jgi:ABC-2 type transport system ATP-binding protein